MKKWWLLVGVLLVALMAWAADVVCPYHPATSTCYDTGQVRFYQGVEYHIYHCTCGDNVLVQE